MLAVAVATEACLDTEATRRYIIQQVSFSAPISWLLGRRARPRRVGRAERSGGLAMSPPGTSRDRSQNYLISIIYKSQGNGGLDKGGEGQENYFSKKIQARACLFRHRT
jgi:hypothetical protein